MRLATLLAALVALLVAPAAAGAADPKPQTGKSVVVKRTGGVVLVSKRGSSRATRLGRAAVRVPVGSTIDASNGNVKLTSTANRSGSKRQSAAFYDGAFTVTQNKASAPITELTLAGGDFSNCTAGKAAKGITAAASSRRRLWGRGRGRFRTRGRNGTATVRGTTWLTEDLCEGTMATARSGRVETNSTEFDLERQLEPGQSVIYYCNTGGFTNSLGERLSDLYCLVVLSQPADNIFGFGIATSGTAANEYQLCIAEPDGRTECDVFPFGPEEGGIKAGGVGCLPAQAGEHYAGWGIGNELLPIPLPFDSNAAGTSFCVSSPPRPGIDPPAKVSREQLGKLRTAAGIGD